MLDSEHLNIQEASQFCLHLGKVVSIKIITLSTDAVVIKFDNIHKKHVVGIEETLVSHPLSVARVRFPKGCAMES